MCVTSPDIEWFCKRISDCGGKQRIRIWQVVQDKVYIRTFVKIRSTTSLKYMTIIMSSKSFHRKHQTARAVHI